MKGSMNNRLGKEIQLLYNKICQGIADPKRIFILYELHRQPYQVGELVDALQLPQSTVSHHLKILRERSLVTAERDGVNVTYSIADTRIIDALDIFREVLRGIMQREAQLAEFSALEGDE